MYDLFINALPSMIRSERVESRMDEFARMKRLVDYRLVSLSVRKSHCHLFYFDVYSTSLECVVFVFYDAAVAAQPPQNAHSRDAQSRLSRFLRDEDATTSVLSLSTALCLYRFDIAVITVSSVSYGMYCA